MNYTALTTDELLRMAITDQGAKDYLAENAEKIVGEAVEIAEELWMYDPAACYDDGQANGCALALDELKGKYADDLESFIESKSVPEEFWTMLAAILADIRDDPE